MVRQIIPAHTKIKNPPQIIQHIVLFNYVIALLSMAGVFFALIGNLTRAI
jgi:hypothetical protein